MDASDRMSDASPERSAFDNVNRRLSVDKAAQHFGIEVDSVSDDAVCLSLHAQPWMINGHGILHGAALFWLGDTAFAFLSEAKGTPSVSRHADITFISSLQEDTKLMATAREKIRFGRNSIVEVDLTDRETLIGRMTIHGSSLRRHDGSHSDRA